MVDYFLGDYVFKTKKSMLVFVAAWVQSKPHGYVLTSLDMEWVNSLLKMHPRYDEKCKGMTGIMIKSVFKHNCFFIIKDDGSMEDISYIKCVSGKDTSNEVNIHSALRWTIHDQISEFKECIFNNPENPITCPISAKILKNDSSTHIDHNYEVLPFVKLVKEFIIEEGIALDDVKTETTGTHRVLCDASLASRFVEYHRNHATLRAIHKDCNLRQKPVNTV